MGQIQLEIFEFALLVNHQDGLTVLFPEVDHVLLIRQPDGHVVAVKRGADLELRGPGGVELPAAVPQMTDDYRKFVVDVNTAEATNIPVPAALLDRTVPPSPALLNGRLLLRQGTITGRECSIPENRTEFTFKGGDFLVTDTAVFTIEVPDGEHFVLTVDGEPAMSLPDGSFTRIMNSDGLGAPRRPFETLDEFVRLCEVLGHRGEPPNVAGGPIRPMGGRPICAIARMSVA